MRKFGVFSGFLGAGKTTLLTALTQYYSEHHGKAAMISNDLGTGVTLADHRLARLCGARAEEITGECICYCHDVLTARLDALFDEGCELVLSDIPGFGVGALEHVCRGLNEKWPGRYTLAPFTVVIEPERARMLREGREDDVSEIIRAQMQEADLIVLSKIDLVSPGEMMDLMEWLVRTYRVLTLAVSAATGAGLYELASVMQRRTCALKKPEIDWNGKLRGAMGRMSEYYLQYRAAVCCDDFDGTAYLAEIARRVSEGVAAAGADIPHMKLLGWTPEGDFGKLDLLGAARPAEVTRPFAGRCTDLAVVLNATALCPAETLDRIITAAAEDASRDFDLDLAVDRKDCFGMK